MKINSFITRNLYTQNGNFSFLANITPDTILSVSKFGFSEVGLIENSIIITGGIQDGVYTKRGVYNGRPFYNLLGQPTDNLDGDAVFFMGWSNSLSKWTIWNSVYTIIYYSTSNVITPNLATNWKNANDNSAASIIVSNNFSSDQNPKIEFNFVSGKIYDWNQNFVSVYNIDNINQPITISGAVGSGAVDYFINNQPVAFGVPRASGDFNTIYADSYYGDMNLDLFIDGEVPNYTFSSPIVFEVVAPFVPVTVYNTSSPFTIFSGDLSQGQNQFSLIEPISGIINNSGTFYLIPDQVNPPVGKQDISFQLYTNFGIINPIITMSGKADLFSGLSFSLIGPTDVQAGTPAQFFTNFSNSGEVISVIPYLQYLSGVETELTTIPITGDYQSFVTGFIKYSGNLQKSIYVTGSGFNDSGNLISGSIDFLTSNFQWATGKQSSSVTMIGSGIGITDGYTGLASGLMDIMTSGNILDGSGFYHGTGQFINSSILSPYVYSMFPTGVVQATGAIYYNSPVDNDVLYIHDFSNPIIKSYHYTGIDSLTSYINANLFVHNVTGNKIGQTIYLTSLLTGSLGNSTFLSTDALNLGNMNVNSSGLLSGKSFNMGMPLTPIGSFTGHLNQNITGSGTYVQSISGLATGNIIVTGGREFTGVWDLQTGFSLDSMKSYRTNAWLSQDNNTYVYYDGKIIKEAGNFYINVLYNGNGTQEDQAILYVSGLDTNHFVSKILKGVG